MQQRGSPVVVVLGGEREDVHVVALERPASKAPGRPTGADLHEDVGAGLSRVLQRRREHHGGRGVVLEDLPSLRGARVDVVLDAARHRQSRLRELDRVDDASEIEARQHWRVEAMGHRERHRLDVTGLRGGRHGRHSVAASGDDDLARVVHVRDDRAVDEKSLGRSHVRDQRHHGAAVAFDAGHRRAAHGGPAHSVGGAEDTAGHGGRELSD